MLKALILILIFGHIALWLKLKEIQKEISNEKKYRCIFTAKLLFKIPQNDVRELELENAHPILLPIMPFIGLKVSDCLNPIAPYESGEGHDFKEFYSGTIEQLKWNNFTKCYECTVSQITISEETKWPDLEKELYEIGWKPSAMSVFKLGLSKNIE